MEKNKAWLFWGCGISFYLYQFILRVYPSVMVNDLMAHFAIDASTLGILAGFYYKSYALFQIPCGIIADRFGPRSLIKSCFLLCIIGTFLFSLGISLQISYLGRFLTGLGSIGGLISTSCLIRHFFPQEKLGFMMSLTMTMGCVGALTGGTPVALSVEAIGWQKTLFFIILLGIFLLVIGQRILKATPSLPVNSGGTYREGIKNILKTPQIWIAAFCALGLYLPLSVFADLWGTSFIMVACKVPKSQAALVVSFVYIGLCIGSLIFAFAVEKFQLYRPFIILGLAGIWSILGIVLSLYIHSIFIMAFLLFFLGIFTGAEMLCFTTACYHTSPAYNGITVAFVNTITMAAGALLQPFVGYLLDQFHSKNTLGFHQYTATDFRFSLSIVVVIAFFCWIFSFFLKEPLLTSGSKEQ
jgi:MFS family permease